MTINPVIIPFKLSKTLYHETWSKICPRYLITECKYLCSKKDKVIDEVIMLGRSISTSNF